MKTIDKVVIRETRYIASWVLILSAIMEAVFLVIGKWNYTVLLGNLLGGCAAILNFLALGITIQRAVSSEEKQAKQAMQASGTVRNFVLFLIVLVGYLAPVFNLWTVIIPLFFPRIAVAARPILDMKSETKAKEEPEQHEE